MICKESVDLKMFSALLRMFGANTMAEYNECMQWIDEYSNAYKKCCHSFATFMKNAALYEKMVTIYHGSTKNNESDTTSDNTNDSSEVDVEQNSEITTTSTEIQCILIRSNRPVLMKSYESNNAVYYKLSKVYVSQRIAEERIQVCENIDSTMI